jgi:hypothetical protein
MVYKGVILSINREEEDFRYERLKRLLDVFLSVCDYRNGESKYFLPKRIHDHKGNLEVYYNTPFQFTDNDLSIWEDCWSCFCECFVTVDYE